MFLIVSPTGSGIYFEEWPDTIAPSESKAISCWNDLLLKFLLENFKDFLFLLCYYYFIIFIIFRFFSPSKKRGQVISFFRWQQTQAVAIAVPGDEVEEDYSDLGVLPSPVVIAED